ncbi:MAG TPA: methyltransferase domain-containing protein [Candidatus Dormibacteraeota bacterium]|nr:methyltransferase domain-containing protein [Candidatus Dormibacteraeota bacterium]
MKEAVRSRYADAARRLMVTESDPSADCCGPGSASLGCGNPTALAELKPGEVVLDLGSGAGLDVLMAARRVGPGGHAYGVDMTDEMLELAERNREKAGIPNATFLRGTIENVPLPDASVDVVISNCVINLAEDKGAVIKEAFRVLRPGGRFAVADMVELEPLHPSLKTQLDSWAGCISGTISIDEYRAALVAAGFAEPEFEVHDTQALPGVGKVGSAHIRALKPAPA